MRAQAKKAAEEKEAARIKRKAEKEIEREREALLYTHPLCDDYFFCPYPRIISNPVCSHSDLELSTAPNSQPQSIDPASVF